MEPDAPVAGRPRHNCRYAPACNVCRPATRARVSFFCLAGCTNLPKAQDYSTSLGESQSQLRQAPDWNAGRVWVRPGPTTRTCATTGHARARWTI